ncbi:MAG: Gfo/Idh/MocA family oxidoreductase [Planctomycetes bacterium]|nr:Gfo/Idh/MocA family oxidoreductase [Planctomycetota bacterium]
MLKVALIGYGYWGPNILRNIMDNGLAEVSFCCDLDKKKLERAKRRYPAINISTDAQAVLRHPDVEAVIIATPVSTHFSLASEALRAGKHIMVEKPLAASVKEAEELQALTQKYPKQTVMVGHTFLYSPPVLKMKEILSSGELGKIFFVSSRRVNLGIHQKDVSVIWDLAPHDFSILFYLLAEEPAVVRALGRDCVKPGLPDVAFINLKFPSGLIGNVELSWLAPTKLRETIIVGSKKMLVYNDTETVEKIKIFDHGVDFKDPESFGEYQLSYRTGNIVSPKIDGYEPLGAEIAHFADCIKTGKTPRTDIKMGVSVVRALEMAEKSL